MGIQRRIERLERERESEREREREKKTLERKRKKHSRYKRKDSKGHKNFFNNKLKIGKEQNQKRNC